MGDVFEAMNRAKREQGKQDDAAPGSDAAPNSELPPQSAFVPKEEAAGGLPLDAVEAQAIASESLDQRQAGQAAKQAASETAAQAPVAAAADLAAAEEMENRFDLDFDADTSLPVNRPSKLNGYSSEVVVHHDRGSAVTEQYRAIRTQLLARARNKSMQVTVLTSSTPEEGKSVTTANMGIVFSELRNKKTLLIEGDLRRPSFNKLFDRDTTPGMLQLLRGEVDRIDDALHPTIYDNLQFIPAGGRDTIHSTELLSSPRMVQVLEQLKDRYDHIFIDSPPVITVTDSCILGSLAEQVLLVVRLNKTPSTAVERAKRLLRANNCEVSGVILTHMKHYVSRYLYKYSYGYGYGYGGKR